MSWVGQWFEGVLGVDYSHIRFFKCSECGMLAMFLNASAN